MRWTHKDIKHVTFIFEDGDSIFVPASCFKDLLIASVPNGLEVEAHILDDGTITGKWKPLQSSPLQRLDATKDLETLDVELITGETFCGDAVWEATNSFLNLCIETQLKTYKECVISINRQNAKYDLKQVLHLPVGTIVVDEKGAKYELKRKGTDIYLDGAIVSYQTLNQTFKIVI